MRRDGRVGGWEGWESEEGWESGRRCMVYGDRRKYCSSLL